jgi:hypothetical protein
MGDGGNDIPYPGALDHAASRRWQLATAAGLARFRAGSSKGVAGLFEVAANGDKPLNDAARAFGFQCKRCLRLWGGSGLRRGVVVGCVVNDESGAQ